MHTPHATAHETRPRPARSGRARWRRTCAGLVAAVACTALGTAFGASPVHAALACGLNELDQNVFEVNNGLWSNAANWSRNHTPVPNEAVCVPGGVVALVTNASTYLLAAQDGTFTTLRVEGTIRIQSGTQIGLASAIYGSSNLFNGGVIQVLNNSTLDLNPDQNGAPAFQNVVGGSLIQVQGGSRIYLRRPFLNTGTINLTGGGEMVLDSSASAYSGTGSVIGGTVQQFNGTITYGGPGSLSVLATAGAARGTVGVNQSLQVACNTFSNAIDMSQGLTNNGAISFLPPIAGACSMGYTLPTGKTLTNNGTITFGTAPGGSNSALFSSNFFNRDGLIVNSSTGSIVVNDFWSSLEQVNNAGTITITSGGFVQQPYNTLFNTGTLINGGRCDLKELDSSGGTVELIKACGVRTKATFTAASTLRPHWTPSELTRLTVTQASPIDGTIDVVTDGAAPAAGTTRDVITGPVSGRFDTVTSQSASVGYTAVYPTDNSAVQLQAGAGGGAISAMVPARLLDTRPSGTTIDGAGQAAGMQSAGSTIEVQVTGRAGVPADATAAVLNVTVTEAQGPGYVTVWPCGTDRPTVSSLNFDTGSTVPNGVISKIGTDGTVCLFAANATQLIADVTGYFTPSSPYRPLVPARLLDTRPGEPTVDGVGQGGGVAAAGSVTEVQVTGRAGVPADASAAVLNVTVTSAQGPGYVTAYPCGTDRPTASNLNFGAGSTVPNNVIAKIGTGGKVCLFASTGTHLIADINGYFAPSSSFTALTPARLLDTRPGEVTVDGAGQGAGAAAAGSVVEVQVTGRAGVPANASAAVLNVTVTAAQGPGYVTAFPCGSDVPTASSLNFGAGSTVPNGLISKVGAGGKVCLFASNGTQLIADVSGWFAG